MSAPHTYKSQVVEPKLENTCLACAIYNVGGTSEEGWRAYVDGYNPVNRALKMAMATDKIEDWEYTTSVFLDFVDNWWNNHVNRRINPTLLTFMKSGFKPAPIPLNNVVVPNGSGLATLYTTMGPSHVVAYHDGLLYDSNDRVVKGVDPLELSLRYLQAGILVNFNFFFPNVG